MTSTLTRADDYISLNTDRNGGYDSNVDNGRAAESSSSSSSPMRGSSAPSPPRKPPPPYTRIVLMSDVGGGGDDDATGLVGGTLPPSLVEIQQQSRVSLEEWGALWSRVQPKIDTMKRCSKQSAALTKIVFCLYIILILLIVSSMYDTVHVSLFPVILVGVLMAVLFGIIWHSSRSQKEQFESLQQLFRDEEDRVFRRKGVVIECEYELCNVHSSIVIQSAYVVYFMPQTNTDTNESLYPVEEEEDNPYRNGTRNGYLRIAQFVTSDPMRCGNGRESFSMSHLESYRTLPTTVSTNDLATTQLWDRFWPRMMEASHDYASAVSRSRISWGLCLVFVLLANTPYFRHWLVLDVCLLIGLLITLLMVNYASQNFQRIAKQRVELVNEYGPEFATLGLWVELRCYGRAHYLYVIPLPQASSGEYTGTIIPALV